jgi:cytidylate kinase
MATLRVELEVREYGLWRGAFDKDVGGRERSGVRRYRIFRPVDSDDEVMLDLDFDTTAEAAAFIDILRAKVWPSPDNAPAKVGAPTTRILQIAEAHEY